MALLWIVFQRRSITVEPIACQYKRLQYCLVEWPVYLTATERVIEPSANIIPGNRQLEQQPLESTAFGYTQRRL